MIKKLFTKMHDRSMTLNKENILDLLDRNDKSVLLDLGCDDGKWTMKVASRADAKTTIGIEIFADRAKQAEKSGVKTIIGNLNSVLPFMDNTFDIVHANQVIEHVGELDLFISEIHRVLKTNGYAIISTENGSSWHNIFAAIFGWQIFSLTNMSNKKSGIGNPFAIHRNDTNNVLSSSWTHKTILNYRGFKELFEAHGFEGIEIKGAGYYPLSPGFGSIDVRHSHFITLKGYKT